MSQWRVRLALLALVLTFGVGLWVKRDEVRVGMERRRVSEKAVVREAGVEATVEKVPEVVLTQVSHRRRPLLATTEAGGSAWGLGRPHIFWPFLLRQVGAGDLL